MGTQTAEFSLQQEALQQLAWNEDPEGVVLATKALAQPDHRIRGTAAQVLAYYGSPRGDAGKPALLEALKTADESDRPQIVWALVTLKEAAVFPQAMDAYRAGFLTKVERLGGGGAFDPELLSGLVPLEKLAALADDPSPSVRQLIATVISRNADSKWTRRARQARQGQGSRGRPRGSRTGSGRSPTRARAARCSRR